MALREMSMAEVRLEVLAEPQLTGDPVTVVCRRRKVSRDRFYEYRRRYQAQGPKGLEPRSRRPKTNPNRTASQLEQLICDLRRRHRRWGARTIRNELRRKGIKPPATSTIGQILKRNNLIESRPRKRPAPTRFERPEPNELWQIDATQVRLVDGTKAWVIDALDDHSRFLVGALACRRLNGKNAWDCLETGFVTARPKELLTDNGLCFTGRLRGQEVIFERALADAGIDHIMSTPYHPQTLGKIERFHQTLKDWLEDEAVPETIEDLQVLLDRFRDYYNHDRCHQGIGDVPPIERFARNSSTQPGVTVERSSEDIRKVRRSGTVVCRGNEFYVGRRHFGVLVTIQRANNQVRILLGDEVLQRYQLDSTEHYYGPGR